ncbi:hypothetical protein ACFC8N_42885 [Streptomyces sp. NPDC055966]|uniref:hypothetical protein n=1 Tax=Streptomyces sp. NPDC055966 TaxID=3345669 RepID=UPI0035DFC573
MTSPAEDEFTELVDADIPRVDLVDKAANGTTFLIAKQAADGQAGLLEPSFVRDLIGKPEPVEKAEETVTMTGSPGAIARMIHEAAVRKTSVEDTVVRTSPWLPTGVQVRYFDEPVEKAKHDTADRKRMASSGAAMSDGSYPIADRADLENAIHAVGRGGADHDAIRRHIVARAKALGATSMIPDNWAANGSLKKERAVADEDMDPMTIMADPEDGAPGNPTTPGSPAWEAIDAATARKWTGILARARAAIDVLSDREMMEAASGADPDDEYQAYDLQDACCAIDYAISVLAPFAVAEQAEADCGEEMAAVGKALADFDPTELDTIEAFGAVAKAGRVLSSANEAAIRGAVDSLQKVLASLPTAPTTDEESGRPVAKTAHEEADMPQPTPSEDVTRQSGEEPAMGAQQDEPKPVAGLPVTDMAKADGEKEMVAVYDQKGRLVGIVDPEKITRIAGAESDDDGDDSDGEDAPTDDDTDGADDGAPETSDMDPAPADQVGTPADAAPSDDDVTKTEPTEKTDNATSDDVLKSSITDLVKAALDAHSATQTEQVTKVGDAVLELAELVETLKGRIGTLEEQPAEPKVFTNGAVPPRDQLRGQDRGANANVDVTKAAELRKQLYGGTAAEQNQAATEMNSRAIEALQAIHQRR